MVSECAGADLAGVEALPIPVVDGLRGRGALALRRYLQIIGGDTPRDVGQLLMQCPDLWVVVCDTQESGWKSHLHDTCITELKACAAWPVTL